SEIENERGEIHRLRYDSAGRLIEEHTFDGRVLRYRRSPDGAVKRCDSGSSATTFSRDAAGRLVERCYADDTADCYEYDAVGRLIRAKTATTQCDFVYDRRGRLTKESQTIGGVTHYVESVYDAIDKRIRRTTSLQHTDVMRYDGMGAPCLV